MSDFLLSLSKNPTAKKAIKALGLPIPTPQILARGEGPWADDDLAGKAVWLQGEGDEAVSSALRAALAGAGCELVTGALAEGVKAHAVIIDASAVASAADLRLLYDAGHPGVAALGACGRLIVVGRPVEAAASASQAAAFGALEGFTRSAAKELGRKGTTAQLLRVAPGAEAHLAGALRFFLSPRSAYVTGQPLTLTPGQAPPAEAWAGALSGKVAVVTGGGRGIGKMAARRLAAEGARVIVVERPDDEGLAQAVASEIGGRAAGVDVAAPAAAVALARILKEEGGADVIVHNAGITRDKTLGRMGPEHWDPVLKINLGAIVEITDHLLGEGLINEGARIVGLSSIGGIAGNAGQTNYGATKAGVIGWVRHLAGQLAERGIRVNAVAPGFIETRMTAAMPFAIREVARRMNSLGQGGQPVDVAEAITFFSLPASSGITGQYLRVCGGSLVGA